MNRAKYIFTIISVLLFIVSSQFAHAQNTNVNLTKLPAHIKLVRSWKGLNTQSYVDAVSKADFERYRYQDKIRILRFESGVEFKL